MLERKNVSGFPAGLNDSVGQSALDEGRMGRVLLCAWPYANRFVANISVGIALSR